MTEEELTNIQNIYFDNAVDILIRGDDIPSIGYMFARAGREDGILEDGNFKLEIVKTTEKDTDDDEGYSMIAVNMVPDDEELLGHMISIFPNLGDEIAQMMDKGKRIFGLSEEEVIGTAVTSILKVNNINRGDIVAHVVKNLCKVTKAFAFMHISAAYQIPLEGPQERTECIMSSLEGHNFRRLITAPIIRSSPDDGKIISVGQKEEQVNYQAGGRFASLLQTVD